MQSKTAKEQMTKSQTRCSQKGVAGKIPQQDQLLQLQCAAAADSQSSPYDCEHDRWTSLDLLY